MAWVVIGVQKGARSNNDWAAEQSTGSRPHGGPATPELLAYLATADRELRLRTQIRAMRSASMPCFVDAAPAPHPAPDLRQVRSSSCARMQNSSLTPSGAM